MNNKPIIVLVDKDTDESPFIKTVSALYENPVINTDPHAFDSSWPFIEVTKDTDLIIFSRIRPEEFSKAICICTTEMIRVDKKHQIPFEMPRPKIVLVVNGNYYPSFLIDKVAYPRRVELIVLSDKGQSVKKIDPSEVVGKNNLNPISHFNQKVKAALLVVENDLKALKRLYSDQ